MRQGLQQAIQKGDVKGWLDSLAPQTDEYRALSQAHLHYLQAGREGAVAADRRRQADQAGRAATRGFPQIAAALRAGGYHRAAQQQRRSQVPRTPHRRARRPLLAGAGRRGEDSCRPNSGSSPTASSAGDTLDALNAGPGLSRAPAGGRDGAAALAAAQPAGDADRRQHRRRPSSIIGATASTSTTARSSRASRTSRRRSFRRRSSGWSPSRPGRCRKGSASRSSRPRARLARRTTTSSMKDGKWVQQSGPKNSLGLVKFDMDDKEAIYLHDTPAKALFAHARPASQPRLRAGRECARSSRPRSPSRRAFSTSSSRRCSRTTRPSSSCQDADPRAAALPDRVLGRLARPVPARRLWLGRQCRQGARPRAGPAASRSSSRKAATTSGRNELRAPDRAGALIPLPTSDSARISQPRISGSSLRRRDR